MRMLTASGNGRRLRSRQDRSQDLLEETMAEHRGSGQGPVAGAETEGPNGLLRRGALGLPAAVMQGVSHIAPAVGMVLTLQFITSLAGVTAPLAYALAFVIVLTLGVVLTQLAKHLPSAGGYYTYVSKTVHPRAGFLVSWLYIFYSPIFVGVILA